MPVKASPSDGLQGIGEGEKGGRLEREENKAMTLIKCEKRSRVSETGFSPLRRS